MIQSPFRNRLRHSAFASRNWVTDANRHSVPQTRPPKSVKAAALAASSEKFSFHFVFFPTASLVFREGFNMIAVVTRIACVERGVVNLLAYPSLTRNYGRVAVVALFGGITDHFLILRGIYIPQTS